MWQCKKCGESVDDDFEVSVGLDDSDEVPPEEPVAVDDDPVEGAGLEGDDQARQAEPHQTPITASGYTALLHRR